MSFEVAFLDEAKEFLDRLDKSSRNKIYYNIRKSQIVKDSELLKKLNANIWEFRTKYNSNNYRLFAFWDKTEKKNILIIATHGIIKKTKKTPKREIEKAEDIRQKYFK